MRSHKLLLLWPALCSIAIGHAQSGSGYTDDFGAWFSLSVRQRLPGEWRADAETELRIDENMSAVANLFGDVSVSRKAGEHFRAGANLRFGNKRNDQYLYEMRSRYAVDLTADKEIGAIEVSFRSRFQGSGLSVASDSREIEFSRAWRNKVGVSGKLMKGTSGQISYELFNSLSTENRMELTDWRLALKVTRKVNKKQDFSLGYMMQGELNRPSPRRDYVILMGYSFNLKEIKKRSLRAQDAPQIAPKSD